MFTLSLLQISLHFPRIKEATVKVDPGIEPLRMDAISDLVKESVEPGRRVLNACLLIGLFGLLASFTGILVVTSQIIESQRRECGIRLALGDTAAGVVRSLCGPVVFWAVLGSGCGIFAGTVVQEKMSTLIYLNKGLDIQIALAAGLIVVISICFGLISPVQAIFRINPAELLRTLTDEAGTRG